MLALRQWLLYLLKINTTRLGKIIFAKIPHLIYTYMNKTNFTPEDLEFLFVENAANAATVKTGSVSVPSKEGKERYQEIYTRTVWDTKIDWNCNSCVMDELKRLYIHAEQSKPTAAKVEPEATTDAPAPKAKKK